jgi:hypothetical protein
MVLAIPGEAEAVKQRVAVVHIGLEKTGSTALQHWLAQHHQHLQAEGIVMPRSLGFPNHTRLVAACLDDGVVDNLKAHLMRREGLSEAMLRRWVEGSLAAELRHAGDWHTLLITSELISSRLGSATEIERLVKLLRRYVDRICFVLVLRRQDHLAVSRFSSVLRSGFDRFDAILTDLSPFNFRALPPGRSVSDETFFYDFESIVARFASVPDSELLVRRYGERQPVVMMADVLGLTVDAAPNHEPRVNSAMSAQAQCVIAQLNQQQAVQWPSGLRREDYRNLLWRVEQEVRGLPRLISQADAERFLHRYQVGNQRLADAYGLGPALFSEAVDRYPTQLDYGDLAEQTRPLLLTYQAAAQVLPRREAWVQRLDHRLRGLKHGLFLLRESARGFR